jgi:L-alanine-DL-glutamate epimerase-like enolase superfamily enzyme
LPALIDNVQAFALRYPEPHDSMRIRCVTLARVETVDGIVGWGECISQMQDSALATKVLIDRGFAPLLQGADATDVRARWEEMRGYTYWHGQGGIASFAISALDTALWDIAGKAAGLPVHALLGGKLSDRLRVCASVIMNTLDLDALGAEFADYRARGYTWIKGGWGQEPSAGFGTDEERDVAVARTVRDAVGPDVEISLDISARANLDSARAVRLAQRLEEFDLAWLEDPLHHEDVEGYRRIRAATEIRIATGERAWTLDNYRRLVHGGAVDILLLDPGRIEGVTGTWRAAQLADAARVGIVPHSWSSALNTAAALHVFAASRNVVVFELKPNESPMQHELVTNPFAQVDGMIAVPDAPGLGVEVDEAVVSRYSFD